MMKEFQMDIHLSCPWCGGSEILADRRTKATISVQERNISGSPHKGYNFRPVCEM